jgi:hypothetical protein
LKKELTLLFPTRGRPKQFVRAVNSALEHADVKVLAYVDEDDPKLEEYTWGERKTHLMVGPRLGTAKSIKKLVEACDTEWMMLGADDIVFETPNWDAKLINLIPKDKVGISFGEDKNERQCNHFVFHRRLHELTGLWPDVFWHFGPDGYLGKVIEGVAMDRRKFTSQVVVRHLQAKAGKSPLDTTYLEERSRGNGRDDMIKAMKFFDRDVAILKAEVERCRNSTSTA